MRQATLEATTFQDPKQRALAFHERRVGEILGGDHELDGVEPQLIAHFIPEGYPQATSLAVDGDIDRELPQLVQDATSIRRHHYGLITEPANRSVPQRAYNLRCFAGGLESVSGAEVTDFGGDELFRASSTEAKIAASANWAQNTLGSEFEGDYLTVAITLVGVEGQEIRIPDAARGRAYVSEPVFNSDRIDAWPVKIPLEETSPADSYNQLVGLFDHLWTDAGFTASIFYQNGTDAAGSMRRYES